MSADSSKVEELIKLVNASSGKDDYCIICHKDQEEQVKELFPNEKIHVLSEEISRKEININNQIFIIPADIKPVKVVYEKTKGEEYDKQEIMERI